MMEIVRIDYDSEPMVRVLGVGERIDMSELDNWPVGTVMSYRDGEWVYKTGGKDAEV